MRFERFSFGSLRVDGVDYEYDLVIDRGEVRKRRKKASKRFREAYGHTPVSVDEDIPWQCRRLVIGTGANGALPVMPEVLAEAERRGVKVVAAPTAEALKLLARGAAHTNAVIHVTC